MMRPLREDERAEPRHPAIFIFRPLCRATYIPVGAHGAVPARLDIYFVPPESAAKVRRLVMGRARRTKVLSRFTIM